MSSILLKAFAFLFSILMGFIAVQAGLVTRDDGKKLGKIIMNFTLPCSVLVSFSSAHFSSSLLLAFAIGLLINVIDILVARNLTSIGYSGEKRGISILCVESYNVGAFAIPFCQAFFPISAVSYLAMYDVPNCFMSLGIGPAIARKQLQEDSRIDFLATIRKMSRSVVVDVYFLGAILCAFSIPIPKSVLTLISLPAQANAFLAMFMIGTQLDFHISLHDINAVFRIFLSRYCISLLVILFLVFVLKVDRTMVLVLSLAFFAPPTSVTCVLCSEIGADTKTAAVVSSLAIPASIFIYLAIMIAFA